MFRFTFFSIIPTAVVTQLILFFFFQAEDGIRDHCVTGVQTCALSILMQTGQTQYGMQTFNQSLATQYFKKQISLTTALSHSSNPDELQEMINRGAGLISQPTVASNSAARGMKK